MRLEEENSLMAEKKKTPLICFEYLRHHTEYVDKLNEVLSNFPTRVKEEFKVYSTEKYDTVIKPDDVNEYTADTNPFYTNEMIPNLVNERLIKGVAADVPEGILPRGYTCSLTDYRPKTRKNDEVMYSKHEILRLMVPRGDCKMELGMPNGSTLSDIVIYGQNKFSGSTFEDEDDAPEDEEPAPNKYFLKNPEEHTHAVIASEKINGEAAHFSGRFIGGQFYLFAGSKNVHMVFQNEEHIKKYTGERYRIASSISLAVLRYWKSFDKEIREALANVMHLTRITIIGELKMDDHQHVVYFKNLTNYELILFSISSAPPTNKVNRSFTAVPTVYALDFLKGCGFDVARIKMISLDEVERNKEEVRSLVNEEGRVYYFEDIEGNTIGLLKHKSLFYVHLRALRQQATYRHRNGSNDKKKTLADAKAKSKKRLVEIQSWLKTSDRELEAWKVISDEWFDWLEVNITISHPSGRFEPTEVRENFPTVWIPFIEELRRNCSQSVLVSLTMLKLTNVLD